MQEEICQFAGWEGGRGEPKLWTNTLWTNWCFLNVTKNRRVPFAHLPQDLWAPIWRGASLGSVCLMVHDRGAMCPYMSTAAVSTTTGMNSPTKRAESTKRGGVYKQVGGRYVNWPPFFGIMRWGHCCFCFARGIIWAIATGNVTPYNFWGIICNVVIGAVLPWKHENSFTVTVFFCACSVGIHCCSLIPFLRGSCCFWNTMWFVSNGNRCDEVAAKTRALHLHRNEHDLWFCTHVAHEPQAPQSSCDALCFIVT